MPLSKEDPLWYKDAIIYELHVKAFKDSNGDGTGDFRGLIEKLDYIQQLGVTAIWLLPFYPSPFKDDGYDISDYRGIHPAYGTLRDFRTLIREAHRRRIKVITELVINHTSDQHPWFQAARRAKSRSARRKYYVWSKHNKRFPETRIIFTDTESSNWTWDQEAQAYFWHRFFSHQPDLNHNNPQVVKAVLKIMRYWLDMGVDGLRLDAVPYLCVRDGTNNENLPETHTVLKQFRKELDKHYTGRMFIAEANQWPEDVLPYFGDNDECHMAYHFPLMPRMFMAIRQEDRHPITDILDRTPDIPEKCQWGLFLRNHDELTLEMVTDAERDYMYREYARDGRMRLNVGIRRRLGPLIDNSRRRMELLNSLLLSLPGTPVIYYGDELGMGDNFYLGDRDGVRTPMQWSMDRNAGFSTADPARLYLPVIMDPVYGYQSINVEAQERDPSSMLHFMRRMISLRRQHKALGRGSIEFIKPHNRTIFAYTRHYKGEIILVVTNLSRFVQPAELDLSAFKGRIPVEMIGRTEFPSIGDLPYFITLGPHSFYWFRLEPPAEPIKTGLPTAEDNLQLPLLTLEDKWNTLLQHEYRYALANDILPSFLARQRWFRGKAKEFVSCAMIDWCKLGASFYLTYLLVRYETGEEETYVMPLKIVHGESAAGLVEQIPGSIVANLKLRHGEGILYDALMDKASCDIIFAAIGDNRSFPTSGSGILRATPTALFDVLSDNGNPCTTVRKLGVEQSNTSIIISEKFVFKLYRKLETGINPDVEISLFLTKKGQFTNIARVAGIIRFQNATGNESTVAMLQEYIDNKGDGWSHALAALHDYFIEAKEMQARGERAPLLDKTYRELTGIKPPGIMTGMTGDYLEAAGLIGRRTAEFHMALAEDRKNPDFKPVKAPAEFTGQLSENLFQDIQQALALLNGKINDFPEEVRKQADQVLIAGPFLLAELGDLADIGGDLGKLIRHHGDYHLGQILRTTDDDFILLDFEGEPLRSLEYRRSRSSALKDVAGMLRSFHYAAHTAFRAVEDQQGDSDYLKSWLQAWYQWVSAGFIREYFHTAADADFLPGKKSDVILETFLLEKAFYELMYELNNRPDWVHIPLAGIIDIIEKRKTGRQKI